ncbi:MAG TPA: glucose-6-phosphate dehydrogenase [Candidatus Woesebacteria bacterium]|nr:glucose-6-phosphate dehydrogenase [Candidatus Woesebacteria bacterium]
MTPNIQSTSKFTLPTIIVIFGITGDLVKKKILKALYDLYIKKALPQRFRVYGFSRRAYDDNAIREHLLAIMKRGNFPEPGQYDKFLSAFFYVKGNFYEPEAYKSLATILGQVDGKWSVCSNKLFYLAVPPAAYETIFSNLAESGLTIPCSPEEGWTRVILEKPFGTNLTTAKKLDMQLGKLFKEEQIYRVDHYLAKETVRNIIAFRFSNVFLEPAWNNKYIEKIEVKLLEKTHVNERGEFYDKVGALRDVGQNHLLQLLALFVMDEPTRFTPEEIKKERADALTSLKLFTKEQIKTHTVRGQYEGYLEEKGVAENSNTETYFKIKAFSDKHDFRGVPLYIESGKGMKENSTEVIVTFKQSTSPFIDITESTQNVLHYKIVPEEKISMNFLAKKPGFEFIVKEHELGFNYRQAYDESLFVDDYEALLYDIIKGDQTLFVSTEEIISQWKFIEPIVKVWNEGTPELFHYTKKTYEGHEL